MPSSSTTPSRSDPPADDAAAREGLGHRAVSGAIAIEGADRAEFLQGQLTQDVRGLAVGESRPAAGLTPKGKLLYFGRLVAERERLLILLPSEAVARTAAHLAKYAAFQKAAVRDATGQYARIVLYGPRAVGIPAPDEGLLLPREGETAGEILVPAPAAPALRRRLEELGSVEVSPATAEVLRIEAGRPRLLVDATDANVPDEVHLQAAISTTKGCYVGQEIVARLRTYGRVSRRLVGFRFPERLLDPGTVFPDPEKPERELGHVTSTAISPRFGPIGLGFAARDVEDGAVLALPEAASATVVRLPFA